MTKPFSIERLAAHHDRLSFACGVDLLDRYLQAQATQDIRRRVSNCFVACPLGSSRVAGYYTLAATGVALTELETQDARRLPRYPVIPAALVGRLAVDREFAGKELGFASVYDAMERSAAAAPAVFALVVDANNARTGEFYQRLGFRPFVSRTLSFYYPLSARSPA